MAVPKQVRTTVDQIVATMYIATYVATITATMRSEVPADSVVVASEWKTSAGLNR